MNPIAVATLVGWVQFLSAVVFAVLVLFQVFNRRHPAKLLRYAAWGIFGILLCGIAFGKYYARQIPRTVAPMEEKDPKAAISDYTLAIRLNPRDPELFFRRGRTAFHLHQYGAAAEDFSKALSLSPNNAKYLANRAYALLFTDSIGSAEQDIQRAIELGYPDAQAKMVRGVISGLRGRDIDAVKEYTVALAGGLDQQNHCYALIDRALVYSRLKDYSKALHDLDDAYNGNCKPEREDILVDRGNTYSEMGQFNLALEDWAAALQIEPNDPVVFKNRGRQFLDSSQFEMALADFNRYVKLRPDDPYGYTIRSSIYQSLSDSVRAAGDLATANKLLSTNRARLYHNVPPLMAPLPETYTPLAARVHPLLPAGTR